MTAGYGYPGAGGGPGRLLAADTDRDRVADVLSTAFTEGRLSRDEYDDRLHRALSARTYGDLDELVADLPGGQPPALIPAAPVVPVPGTNGLAVGSLACGLAQFAVGPLATIPAIVLGHMARGQIRRTGEQGGGLALAGLMLGWGAVVLGVLVVVLALAAISQTSGPPPGP